MKLPGHWADADFDGLVWFRKEVDLPEAWAGKELELHLGPIDDMDTTWFNGVEVGHKDDWLAKRDYKIPPGVAKAGKNVIAVRVLDKSGPGGIYGKPDEMQIGLAGDSSVTPMPLAGEWRYHESTPFSRLPKMPGLSNQESEHDHRAL